MTLLATEPIIGLRQWEVADNNTLESYATSLAWPARQALTAACLCRVRHPQAPAVRGECGIHALALDTVREVYGGGLAILCDGYTLLPERRYPVGLVALWGRVVRGERGVLRAAHAYPAALLDPGPHGLPIPRSDPPRLDRVAEAYGVPVLPLPRTPSALLEVAEWVRKRFRPTGGLNESRRPDP